MPRSTVKFTDSEKALFGAGDDLEIYHDGSNSYVDDAGTGRLYLRGNDRVQIQKYTGEDMFTAIADGATKLYYDNANKLETTNTGVTITGNLAVASGNGIDFSATSDSSGSMSSELLDDYEEGTWTPAPYGGTTAGTYSNLARYGQYTKIGQIVFASGYVYGSITGAAGQANIGGLPFNKTANDTALVTVQWNNSPFTTIASDEHHPVGLVYNDYIFIRASDRVAQGAYSTATWDNGTISYYRFSAIYRIS